MKNALTFVLLTVLFSGSSGYGAFAQDNLMSTISNQFSAYQEQNLQEKLFVHTDKTFYMAGEILWFKIYSVEGTSNKPLDLSKVAYLEVLDKENKAVIQTKVAMKEGSGSGSAYLPVALNSGTYKLRAYTNWMKNFSPDFYFEKNITIVNSLKRAEEQTQKEPAIGHDVAFFPEGGNMVRNVPSKIAFKVTDRYGKGVHSEGIIVDQNNKPVAGFNSLKFGIGSFYLTPEAGKYAAVIKLQNGETLRKELPEVLATGYVMHLEDTTASGDIKITVQNNTSLNSKVYLFAHTRNEKKVIKDAQLINGKTEFLINKNQIGEGISGFTILDDHKQPVCERLYFKRPRNVLNIQSVIDQNTYANRKEVRVNVNVKDVNNQSLKSDLSVSVFRLDSLQAIDQNDILSYLWLNSDLKGIIESPAYYFSDNGKSTDEAADNLMLTHGWRRFKWESALQNKMPSFEFLPEYTGHIVSGKVVDPGTGAPLRNSICYLTIPGKQVQFFTSKSNNEGKVNFYTKNVFGSTEVLAQTEARKDSNATITIFSPFSSGFSANRLPEFNPYDNRLYSQIRSNSVNMQVQNIYWSNQIKRFLPPVADTRAFYGPPARTYLLDKYTRFTTMEEVLHEYVIESALSVSRKQYNLRLMKPDMVSFLDNPLILLDGTPVFNVNDIISYDPLRVRSIDIITEEYFAGPAFFNGIISFRTYNGGAPGLPLRSGAVSLDYDGLQLQREFYSPVYDTDEKLASRLPDFRNLLYWSPDLRTDSNGNQQFSFYTSDLTGKYALVLQGITAGGNPVSSVLTFEVKSQL